MVSVSIRPSPPRPRGMSEPRYGASEAPEGGGVDAPPTGALARGRAGGTNCRAPEHMRLVEESVEHGRRHHHVAGQDLRPVLHSLVRRDDRASALVAVADQPEEQAPLRERPKHCARHWPCPASLPCTSLHLRRRFGRTPGPGTAEPRTRPFRHQHANSRKFRPLQIGAADGI